MVVIKRARCVRSEEFNYLVGRLDGEILVV
jgi:hypothetical protein